MTEPASSEAAGTAQVSTAQANTARVNKAPATTALVTGANRGLGRRIARTLAEAGLAVGLLGRSAAGLNAVAAEIIGAGGRAAVGLADVRRFAEVEAAVREIESALGGVDLLVNNAGVIESAELPVWKADPGEWWDVVESDLRGPFHLVRAVVPGMIDRCAGRVIGLNSNAGAMDRVIYSAYCAAKAGMFRITGNLHLAGHERGVRAFEISPGTVRTDMTASMELHRERTDWTPPEATLELVTAVARGELDAWSGCFLRAAVDTPESLRQALAELGGTVASPRRRLGVIPWGPGDPLD
jgi:NAD(P)-dependent dehydrogenase (short-subunit alcohol dehydrogenase family)